MRRPRAGRRAPPARETRLHLRELARVAHGVAAHRQRGQRLVDRGDAVAGVWVVAQKFGRAPPVLRGERLEEARHVARVVAGLGHHARAFEVGLPLGRAPEAQEDHVRARAAD
jgi:hypothetical protein